MDLSARGATPRSVLLTIPGRPARSKGFRLPACRFAPAQAARRGLLALRCAPWFDCATRFPWATKRPRARKGTDHRGHGIAPIVPGCRGGLQPAWGRGEDRGAISVREAGATVCTVLPRRGRLFPGRKPAHGGGGAAWLHGAKEYLQERPRVRPRRPSAPPRSWPPAGDRRTRPTRSAPSWMPSGTVRAQCRGSCATGWLASCVTRPIVPGLSRSLSGFHAGAPFYRLLRADPNRTTLTAFHGVKRRLRSGPTDPRCVCGWRPPVAHPPCPR
jgi:hypothetical protein